MGFGNGYILPLVASADYEPRLISDHAPLWIQLSLLARRGGTLWKLNSFWLMLFPRPDPVSPLLSSFSADNLDSAGIGLVWDAAKAFLHRQFIHTINNIKSSTKARENMVLAEVTRT